MIEIEAEKKRRVAKAEAAKRLRLHLDDEDREETKFLAVKLNTDPVLIGGLARLCPIKGLSDSSPM